MAIFCAFKDWHHYLLLNHKEIVVWSDHKNLEYFKKLQDLSAQQARWYLYLQEFDYQLEYKPGKTNGWADALSQREDHREGTKNPENKNITFFLENLITKSKNQWPTG